MPVSASVLIKIQQSSRTCRLGHKSLFRYSVTCLNGTIALISVINIQTAVFSEHAVVASGTGIHDILIHMLVASASVKRPRIPSEVLISFLGLMAARPESLSNHKWLVNGFE